MLADRRVGLCGFRIAETKISQKLMGARTMLFSLLHGMRKILKYNQAALF